MKLLNTKTLKEFLKLASEDLKGEWLLVGGTLLPALGISHRSTVDIDLVGLSSKERAQNLEVMKLSEALGLNVETINQSAAHFVNKIGYRRSDLIPLKKGKACTIFRPSCEFYWKLKTARLTDEDLEDCRHYFSYCQSVKDELNFKSLSSFLKVEISTAHSERKKRLQILSGLLQQNSI